MLIEEGSPIPLGATLRKTGVNFSLFSQHASKVSLLLFMPQSEQPFAELALDPVANRTGWIWHVLIKDLPSFEIAYAYKVEGSNEDPKNRFHPQALLSDPYAKGLCSPQQWGDPRDFKATPPRGKLFLEAHFDWEGDRSPDIPVEELIIYEMHVRSFTQHASSKSAHPGTYLAMIEKIPYLKELGVNAVELMPIFEFDECENIHVNPRTKEKLKNVWGYSTMNFFAPMPRYSASKEWKGAIDEFRTLVKELHKNDIEVLLDVVYNHTAEGSSLGPYFSFRGIDNQVYYIVDSAGKYLDFTGTGNTVNANHPVVSRLIIESLHYWVTEMHVDGFRFDLASCLTRDETGKPLLVPPLIHLITHNPVLRNVKLIAEAWDAGGLFQVGTFPGEGKWAEWNGKYRDDVRRFLKGTNGYAGAFATALCGSQNLYGSSLKPYHSINFITAHDGYSLRDLVSYQDKHNMENGENNRDGNNENDSWNCGEEGPTTNVHILQVREQQMRNLHMALMFAIGTPMLLMGDEYGHTRKGNNNAYPQDNELNFFLWDELKKNEGFVRFHRLVIRFRKEHKVFQRKTYLKDEDIDWHSQKPLHPDWHDDTRFIAYTLKDHETSEHIYIAFNAGFKPADIDLPPPPSGKNWYRVISTSLPPPQDFSEHPKAAPPLQRSYTMCPYSALVAKALH